MGRTLVLLLLSLPLCAQVAKYRDIEWYEDKGGGKINKVDGRIYIDRAGGALVFVKENDVRRAQGAKSIRAIRYYTQGDQMLILHVVTPEGRPEPLRFRLKGGSNDRESVVAAVEALSGLRADRINSEWKLAEERWEE